MSKQNPIPEEILSIEEAAALLKITRDACYLKAYRREIPSFKQGRLILFDKKLLLQWLARGYQPPIGEEP